MYHNSLSFFIISKSNMIENTLKNTEPPEDCSLGFFTAESVESLPPHRSADTAYIFDCTGTLLEDIIRDVPGKRAAVFSPESPELRDPDSLFDLDDVWVLMGGENDERILQTWFSRFALRMKEAADARKQGICFNTLIDSVPDISWFKDTGGAHLIVNDSFCNMVGKTKAQIYKKGHCFIWDATPEDEAVCLSSDQLIMDSRKTNTFEEEVVTNNGTLLLKSYKSPLIDDDGSVFGTCGIARDVTEFKNATTEIKILLDSFPYVVLLEDENENVMSKNMIFDAYFPDFSDITGKPSAEWKKSLRVTTLSDSSHREVIVEYQGKEHTLLLEEEPLLDIFYHENGKIITLADITYERKISRELEESREKAQEANRAKSLFIANMSHEIRTPINSVIGLNEMILRESEEKDIRGYALGARRSAKMLLSLVNDILDFSKIESGKMDIICADYMTAGLISDAVNIIAPRADAKGLALKLEFDPFIPAKLYGDDVRLRQIITNLLTNAVKYTKEGTVTFSVGGEEDGDDYILRVSVRDTGIGIKQEDISRLFDAFSRLDDNETRNIEGTGLGLNITIRLLTLMDSKLEVESEYGKGSVFSFALRQKIVDREPAGSIEIYAENEDDFTYSASFAAPDAKVLIVDDNEMNRVVFRSLLKQTKVQVTEAAGGRECLELAEKERFDIIFLDHMMPGMDGIETFHRMNEKGLLGGVPVIALTANAVSGARESYISEGFTDFLSKPIYPAQLEKMLVKYLPDGLVSKAEESADESAPADTLPEIEGFNFAVAKLYAKSDGIISSSLGIFGDNLLRSAALLGYYLPFVLEGNDGGMLELYRIQAHSLKGTAAIVGEMQISELAKTAEFAAKASDIRRIEAITPILIEEARVCLGRLEAAGIYKPKPACPDIAGLAEKTERIKSLAEDFMLDEADGIMNELASYSYPEDIFVQIELLKTALVNCDNGGISSAAEKIKLMTL